MSRLPVEDCHMGYRDNNLTFTGSPTGIMICMLYVSFIVLWYIRPYILIREIIKVYILKLWNMLANKGFRKWIINSKTGNIVNHEGLKKKKVSSTLRIGKIYQSCRLKKVHQSWRSEKESSSLMVGKRGYQPRRLEKGSLSFKG